MKIVKINTKREDFINSTKYYDDEVKKATATEIANAANIVAGGIASTLIAQPRWQPMIRKAGFNILKFSSTDGKLSSETDYCLVFQYNPSQITETHKVGYEIDKDIFNGKFTTKFTGVNPRQLNLRILLDSFYDYISDDFTNSILSGVVQGALLAVKAGSNGLDAAAYAMDAVGNHLDDDSSIKKKLYADRNIINALENLRELTKLSEDKYYKYDSSTGKFTLQKSSEGALIVSSPPVICTLDWEGYKDIKFVVTSMDITSVMFNPKNLKPMRCTVNFELLEYSNKLDIAMRSLDGGTLLSLFKEN